MDKQTFVDLVKAEQPNYTSITFYKKIDGKWQKPHWVIFNRNEIDHLLKDKPSDDFGNNGEVYVQTNDERIKFCTYHSWFISAKHYGWECPGMYHDCPPENGNCEISDTYWDVSAQYMRRGLFLNFTSDDYGERIYLSLEVLDLDTLLIVYDDLHREGTLLIRMMPNNDTATS